MEKMPKQLNSEWLPEKNETFPDKEYFELSESEQVAETMDVVRNTYQFFPTGTESMDDASYEVIEYVPSPEAYNEEPIVFMQGFMAIPQDYDATLATMAERTGKRVIGWNELVGIEVGDDVEYEEDEMVPDTQLSKVLGMKELLNRLDIDRATVVAHSEGCMHAVALEVLSGQKDKSITEDPASPDGLKREEGAKSLFHKMVLLNPAGIVNKSVPGLIISGIQEGSLRKRLMGALGTPEDFLPTGYKKLGSGSWSDKAEIAKHAAKSILNMTRYNTLDYLLEMDNKYYKDFEDEPKIAMVNSAEDRLFPAHKLNKKMMNYGAGIFSLEEVVTLPETDHAGVMLDPKRMIENVMPLLKEDFADGEPADIIPIERDVESQEKVSKEGEAEEKRFGEV